MSSGFLICVRVDEGKNTKVIYSASWCVGRHCVCFNTNLEDLCDSGVLVNWLSERKRSYDI